MVHDICALEGRDPLAQPAPSDSLGPLKGCLPVSLGQLS